MVGVKSKPGRLGQLVRGQDLPLPVGQVGALRDLSLAVARATGCIRPSSRRMARQYWSMAFLRDPDQQQRQRAQLDAGSDPVDRPTLNRSASSVVVWVPSFQMR